MVSALPLDARVQDNALCFLVEQMNPTVSTREKPEVELGDKVVVRPGTHGSLRRAIKAGAIRTSYDT